MSDLIKFDAGGLAVSSEIQEKYENLSQLMQGRRDGFEDEGFDWTPAIIKIVQPVTLDPAKPATAKNGDMFHKGGSVKTPMRFVLAYAWTSRVRFVNGVDKYPSCASENVDTDPRHRGALDQSISIYGDSCAKCPFECQPFSQGKPTDCNNTLNVILIPETLENVYQYQFARSGYNVGKQFTELARATPSAWSRLYEFTTEAKKRDKGGLYYVPVITPVSDTPVREDLKAFAQYVNKRVAVWRAPKKCEVRQRREGSEIASFTAVDQGGKKDYTDAF